MAFNLLTISEEADLGIFVENYVASISRNKAFQRHVQMLGSRQLLAQGQNLAAILLP